MDTVTYPRDLALAVGRNSCRKTAFTFGANEKIADRGGDVCCPIGNRIRPCRAGVIAELNNFTMSEPACQISRTLCRRALVACDDEAGRREGMQAIWNPLVQVGGDYRERTETVARLRDEIAPVPGHARRDVHTLETKVAKQDFDAVGRRQLLGRHKVYLVRARQHAQPLEHSLRGRWKLVDVAAPPVERIRDRADDRA